MAAPPSSSALQVATMSSSQSDAPTWWPCALRKVKHMPPPMSTSSATPRSASITLSLSLTFEPPSTATNGPGGVLAQAERAPPPRAARSRPAALGRCCGGPTIDAWARCDAPKASFT